VALLHLGPLPLHTLQQHGRSHAQLCGAALQVHRAALLGLEPLATDGAVSHAGARRRRRRERGEGGGHVLGLIQTSARVCGATRTQRGTHLISMWQLNLLNLKHRGRDNVYRVGSTIYNTNTTIAEV